jgi:hypothetical protein
MKEFPTGLILADGIFKGFFSDWSANDPHINGPITEARNNFSFHAFVADKGSPKMYAADRFLKFASECQVMAELAPQTENKRVWNRLAERWRRCVQLTEQLDTDLRSSELRRRQKHLKIIAH